MQSAHMVNIHEHQLSDSNSANTAHDLYVYINRVSGTVSATPFTLRQLCMILNPPIILSADDCESDCMAQRERSSIEFDLLCGYDETIVNDDNKRQRERESNNINVYNRSSSSLCSTDESTSTTNSPLPTSASSLFSEEMQCCVGSMINPDTVVARVNPLSGKGDRYYDWSKIRETPVLREAAALWYYEVENGWGEVAGPFSCRQLAKCVHQRSINITTRVWSSDGETQRWKSINEHPTLSTAIALFQLE